MKTDKAPALVACINPRLFWFSIATIFISAISYGYGILTVSRSFYSIVTIFFLISLCAVFVANLIPMLRANDDSCGKALPSLLFYALTLHLALILGFYLSGRIEHALWVADSYAVHIPGAVNVANYIHGKESLISLGMPFGGVFLTQAFVGSFFSFLGINPVASAIALMLVKLLTIFVIFNLGKTMFNQKVGLVGVLIYIFSPTTVYYTTVFYKETVVQLLVAIILLYALNTYLKPTSWGGWLTLVVSMVAVANERFYLFIFFATTFILLWLAIARVYRKACLLLGVVVLAFGVYALVGKYADMLASVHVPYQDILPFLFAAVENYRHEYLGYADVTMINSSLFYPLAFIKILFTPFFTLNKFALFSDYSYILIWGSWLNQIVILLSLYGMCKALNDNWQRSWFLLFPYFLFLCLFAYVAPYAGRLRDSFYPLIVIYSAYTVGEIYLVMWVGLGINADKSVR